MRTRTNRWILHLGLVALLTTLGSGFAAAQDSISSEVIVAVTSEGGNVLDFEGVPVDQIVTGQVGFRVFDESDPNGCIEFTINSFTGLAPPFSSGNPAERGCQLFTGGMSINLPNGIAGNNWVTTDVTFAPTTSGEFTDTLIINFSTSQGAGTSEIEVRGVGTVTGGSCTSSNTVLCIDNQPGDGRFRVNIDIDTVQGGGIQRPAKAIELDSLGITRGGIFYFIEQPNPEFLVKVLDGCGINNRFWVFYAATTNVGFDLTVEDTIGNQTRVYTNPDLSPADAVTDTDAFATCP